ncbi:myb-like protein D [Ctenocephalides felis]|uniref:myb-like protein D n=1 Tax=Ctenocephalides felis TaxID=7515 RepID=UPI000E6E53A0|nr:myb-like protein D [Ctenocephalides felis]
MSLNNSAMKSLDSSQEIPSTKSNNEISQVEPKMFGNTINKKKCLSNVKSNCSAFNTKKKHSSTSKNQKERSSKKLKELFGDDREAVKRDKTGIQEIDTEFKNDGFKKVRSRHKRKSEEFLKFGSVKKTNNDLVPNKKKKNQRKRVKNKERNFQQNINNNNKIGQLTAQDETQILPNQHSEEAKSDHGMDNANYNTNEASKFDTDAIQILNVFSVSQGENVDTNKKTNLETSEPANLTQPIGLSMPILDETIECEDNSITSNEEQETTRNSKLDINRNEEITIDSNLSSDKNSRSEPKRKPKCQYSLRKNDLENKVKNMPVSASSITNLSDQEASISSKVNLDYKLKNTYVIPPQAAAEILPELFQIVRKVISNYRL